MGKIVWLASYPKSGNTWTRTFLLNLMLNASKPRSVNDIPKISPSDIARDWYTMVDDSDPATWTPAHIASLRGRVQEKIASHTPDSIFVKTHSPLGPWMGVPLFNMAVTAGAIYIVRNPLDIVASYANHSGLTLDAIILAMNTPGHTAPGNAERVPHPVGSWSENVESWTARPNPGIRVMRYEDMVADPVAAFGGLMAFLGLPPNRERLERAVRFSSFDELRRQEDKDGFIERGERAPRFFRAGQAGGWKKELTTAQARAVVEAHRRQMQRFGYVPEGF